MAFQGEFGVGLGHFGALQGCPGCPAPCPCVQRVLLVPEPCTLDIDGVVFGLTSTDLLFHMGAEEISR